MSLLDAVIGPRLRCGVFGSAVVFDYAVVIDYAAVFGYAVVFSATPP